MSLQGEIKRCVKKRMSRTDKCRQRLSLWSDKVLLECNTFVSRKHGFSQTDQAIPVSYWGRNPSSFIATVFTLTSRSTEFLKRLDEERLDIVRLKSSGFRALHFFAHAMDAAGIH